MQSEKRAGCIDSRCTPPCTPTIDLTTLAYGFVSFRWLDQRRLHMSRIPLLALDDLQPLVQEAQQASFRLGG